MKDEIILHVPNAVGRKGTEVVLPTPGFAGTRRYRVIGTPETRPEFVHILPIQATPYRMRHETPTGVSLEALYTILLHEVKQEQLTVCETKKTALKAIEAELEANLKKYVELYRYPGAEYAKD